MLDIYLDNGLCFGSFVDILLYMHEENLVYVNVVDVKYCLKSIFGKGVYSRDQVEYMVSNM